MVCVKKAEFLSLHKKWAIRKKLEHVELLIKIWCQFVIFREEGWEK